MYGGYEISHYFRISRNFYFISRNFAEISQPYFAKFHEIKLEISPNKTIFHEIIGNLSRFKKKYIFEKFRSLKIGFLLLTFQSPFLKFVIHFYFAFKTLWFFSCSVVEPDNLFAAPTPVFNLLDPVCSLICCILFWMNNNVLHIM
jgi:hypothetical protein